VSAFSPVETERLLLRRPRTADLDAHHRIHADPRTWAHRPELRHTSREQSRRQLAHWLAHWQEHGFGCLMLLRGWRDGEDVLNLYYRLEPESWGRGYATEISRAALALAARELPSRLVVARIRPNNEASMRVAERAGMPRRPELDDEEFLVYASA
jgi:ribosomal-protein-alanine N-acetyltransferase